MQTQDKASQVPGAKNLRRPSSQGCASIGWVAPECECCLNFCSLSASLHSCFSSENELPSIPQYTVGEMLRSESGAPVLSSLYCLYRPGNTHLCQKIQNYLCFNLIYSTLNNASHPNEVSILILETWENVILRSKRDFTDVIQLRSLRLAWIAQWA